MVIKGDTRSLDNGSSERSPEKVDNGLAMTDLSKAVALWNT